MDIRRVILFSAFAYIAYSLWMQWQKDYPPLPRPEMVQTIAEEPVTAANRMLPDVGTLQQGGAEQSVPVQKEATQAIQPRSVGSIIHVKTDVLSLKIDTTHGDIIRAELLDYPVSVEKKDTPITLLTDEQGQQYTAKSSVFTVNKGIITPVDFHFQADKKQYQLPTGEDRLSLVLKGRNSDGVEATKTFVFTRGKYDIDVRYQLHNDSSTPFRAYFNRQLMREAPSEDKSSIFHVGSYTGGSYSNPGKQNFKKVSFKDMGKENLHLTAESGWVAMQQHYFLSAWVPKPGTKNTFYTRANDDDFTIGAVSTPLNVASGDSQTLASTLYIGPEIGSNLEAIAPALDLTIDYGLLWFFSSMLFWCMKTIYGFVGNWGWSIVIVTVLIKLAFYRLSATSYKSMAKMRQLQPKIEALRERYGDDKAKLSEETIKLYKQEKANPLKGCLPILIQIPVFIALYWVLLESVELRQAPFIGWIQDLSVADPWHVLPIIMGATMLIQQRLNPAPPDPMQAKVMMFLPVLFTALFWNFPAGLVLYWTVNNSLSILQQWYITKKYADTPKSKREKKSLAANS